MAWNAWHFGSQHFGIASLLGWRSGPRWRRKVLTIGPTVVVLMLPSFIPIFPLLVLNEVISFAHWTTDIGLSSWKKARVWVPFLCVVLFLGLTGFLFNIVKSDPRVCGLWPVCMAQYPNPVLIGLRAGLGFVHFVYSWLVWKQENVHLMATA
jgi:hypothetical protein